MRELYTKFAYLFERLDKENDEIVSTIKAISTSKELVAYLFKKKEEEFRNVIDSLDEHGDGHIRPKNLVELCKVMQFLQKINIKGDEVEFLESLFDLIEGAEEKNFRNISTLIGSSKNLLDSIKLIVDDLQHREEASTLK